MQLASPAFKRGGVIPAQFTCEGDNTSPEFSWNGAPEETESFVLTLRDPDAPKAGGFTHWVLYNIPVNVHHVKQDIPKEATVADLGLQGRNDSGDIGYVGPCPPSGTHHYVVRLFALDTELNLPPAATYEEVRSAMDRHILARAELTGIYAKQQTRAA